MIPDHTDLGMVASLGLRAYGIGISGVGGWPVMSGLGIYNETTLFLL